jgi:hypothetical protein
VAISRAIILEFDAGRFITQRQIPTKPGSDVQSMHSRLDQLLRRPLLSAAQDWNLPTSEITITKGIVGHASSGRRAAFGELADKAAALPVPSAATLAQMH